MKQDYEKIVDLYTSLYLHDLTESFGKLFSRFPGNLPANDIARDIHYDIGLVFSVIFFQLTKILYPKTGCHLVATCGSYQIGKLCSTISHGCYFFWASTVFELFKVKV